MVLRKTESEPSAPWGAAGHDPTHPGYSTPCPPAWDWRGCQIGGLGESGVASPAQRPAKLLLPLPPQVSGTIKTSGSPKTPWLVKSDPVEGSPRPHLHGTSRCLISGPSPSRS